VQRPGGDVRWQLRRQQRVVWQVRALDTRSRNIGACNPCASASLITKPRRCFDINQPLNTDSRSSRLRCADGVAAAAEMTSAERVSACMCQCLCAKC
jgi:hypothetical protein